MSSTSRGAIRSAWDYYRTNPDDIVTFLRAWEKNDVQAAKKLRAPGVRILDPCAGGNRTPVDWLFKEGKDGKPDTILHVPPSEPSYPIALRRVFGEGPIIETMDIREDAPVKVHGDFLKLKTDFDPHTDYNITAPDIVLSNPPFDQALQFIKHGLRIVRPGGFVVMLLRLNFFGSAKRKPFFDTTMPMATYIHHERMSFTPDGKTDSIEYCHMCWQAGWSTGYTITRVI